MNRHYTKYLWNKYPKLFKGRFLPITQSLVSFGFEVGDGWFNIINNLCSHIQGHIDNKRENRANTLRFNRALKRWKENKDDRGLIHYFTMSNGHVMQTVLDDTKNGAGLYRPVCETPPQVVVTQVKEKFGTLRFYYEGGDDYIDGLVRMAESMTAVTCEVCGDKGKLNGGGWISCRCKKHRKTQ